MPTQKYISNFAVTPEGQLLIDGDDLLMRFAHWEVANDAKEDWPQIAPFDDLALAWSIPLEYSGDVRFVWKMLREDKAILPLYLCPDDLDFSCIVIVAEVEKTENYVYWNRIGYVTHVGENYKKEIEHGILDTDAYTSEDWERFGDNIAWETVESPEWYQWTGENWNEELYRRRMNYTLPYYRDGGGVCWVQTVDYTFERNTYELMLEDFRDIQLDLELDRVFRMSEKNDMNTMRCGDMIAMLSPDGYDALNRHLLNYGEVVLHVLASEQITEPLENYLRQDVKQKIKVYSKAIELMWAKGTTEVVNVVDVTILERLSDELLLWRKFGEYLSEDFKIYINQELIPGNIMISEN